MVPVVYGEILSSENQMKAFTIGNDVKADNTCSGSTLIFIAPDIDDVPRCKPVYWNCIFVAEVFSCQ